MCVQNLKFVALPVPEIIGGTQQIWAVPGYAHAPFSPNILKGFCSDDPVNIPAKFGVRSFVRSWDNRGYFKNLASPWIRPPSLFSQIFKGLFFAWTRWIYLRSVKFVALPVPGIIGGTQKKMGSPWIRPRSLFSKNFHGLVLGWTLWIYRPNLQSVAVAVLEILGSTSKIWGVPGFAHPPYSPKFLIGFCSHGPSEYICQIWRS